VLDQIRKAGVIRVGFANEAPYGYADSSGKLTGEAPAVAGAIMQKLGVPQLEGVLTEFGSLIPGLIANRFDMIAAGMFITAQRCNAILFSNPDYIATEALAVKKGNPHNLTDYQSVAGNPNVVVGAESGAVEGPWLKQSGVSSSKVQLFPDGPTGIQALASGRIDAFALTAISLEYLLKTGGYSNLEVTQPFIPIISGQKKLAAGGYGFRKSDASLVTQFNQQLSAMQRNGELEKLVQPFGFTGATVTGAYKVTSQQLCA
jgi:polar amino acid transport system substrate-binding protein